LEEDLDSNTVYNLPGLSNLKDPVVFIAHFASDKNFTAPANDIEVICDGKIIGKSNEHGLVYIGLNKPPHQEIILTLQKGGKSRTYTLKGDKDFYEYWGAWIN